MDKAISIVALSRKYDNHWAIKGIDVEVPRGSIYGFLGPNGAGKTTTIKMMSGLNIEVLNTDAEGRMILADALHYAKKYEPELVIDVATLTGAAVAAIGKYGIVSMGTANEKQMNKLRQFLRSTRPKTKKTKAVL